MATIAQQPNEYNSAYVPNVWVLDNLGSADRYVLTVNINGSNVATFKQPANPAGVGIFDISKVLQSYLQTQFVEETTYATDTPGSFLSYQISYGTETGLTVAYDGLSTTKHVINAYDNWRVLNSDLSAFLPNPTSVICETPGANVNAVYAEPFRFLTNYPGTYKVRSNEYKTLSFFSRNTNVGPLWGPNEAPFFVVFTYFQNGLQVAQGAYTLANFRGSSLRTDCQDMTVTLTDDNSITTIGVGPQNQTDAGITGTWDSYRVDVMSYNYCDIDPITNCASVAEMLAKADQVIYTADFVIEDDCTPFDPITVSFMNQYGVRDYHTFDRRNTRNTTTTRNNYNKTLGSWSDANFSIDPVGRGKTTFSSEVVTNMTLQTNWMDDATSKWLEELFISPSTMIYVDGAWEPCVITSRDYEQRTYARNQMFQHEIEVEFSNNKNIQRG